MVTTGSRTHLPLERDEIMRQIRYFWRVFANRVRSCQVSAFDLMQWALQTSQQSDPDASTFVVVWGQSFTERRSGTSYSRFFSMGQIGGRLSGTGLTPASRRARVRMTGTWAWILMWTPQQLCALCMAVYYVPGPVLSGCRQSVCGIVGSPWPVPTAGW